jgi:hypothetical protein
MSQRMAEQDALERAKANADMSPLEKAGAAMQAARLVGSGLTQLVMSMPTRIRSGDQAADEYIAENIYQPTIPKATEYVGDFGEMMEQLETKYKIPPIMPELLPFQEMTGPAMRQISRTAPRAAGATGLGGLQMADQGFAGGGLLKGIKAIKKSATNAERSMPARGALRFADEPVGGPSVIKEKGGNWLSGSVEQGVKPLKTQRPTHRDEALTLGGRWAQDADTPEGIRSMAESAAINNWVDRNLTNYIKKEMATPDDPVRRLAEEGITHMPANELDFANAFLPEKLALKRMNAGFTPQGLGESPTAQGWERITDELMNVAPASQHTRPLTPAEIRQGVKSTTEADPWLNKVDPNTPIYYPENMDSLGRDFGFDHIVDVLKEDLAAGRIRPEQLNKVSMEQAVRRTYEYDQEMARKMAEAQIKATEGMPVHKEYPEGYKWVELAAPKMPDVLPEGWSEPVQKGNALQTVSPEGKIVLGFNLPDLVKNIYKRHPETPGNPEKALEDALKYEGDTMGHCVGGYCPDVIQGKSRIYSLRDKRGEPHVTIEVQPMRGSELGRYAADLPEGEDVAVMKSPPQKITQIKGKGNAKPKEEYLPFVQDFVRGGEWSDVGDLKNTGLVRYEGKIMTQAEADDMLYQQLNKDAPGITDELGLTPPPEGMKRGGSVHISDNPDTMMMELGDEHFALGGAALKMARANKAKQAAQAAEKELALPSKLPRAKPRSKEDLRPLAQEMSEATRGDFYRPEPSKSFNPAGKSFDQWKTEQGLVHDIRPTAKRQDIPRADIEKQKDMVKMGISGDTSVAEQVLHEAGPYALDIPSPQHGGALYGLGGEGAWASNNPIAANVQKRINEISEAYGGLPVLGQYMQMGKLGSDFALHFADANLRAIDLRRMSKDQIEMVNELIRKGSPKSGPRTSFPGIEDKDSAYLHFAFDPELRKHFNAIMQKPTYTEPLGLPDGRIIHHAITEPELRNLPVTTTGFSQMELVPGYDPEKLLLSEHPTYSHVIPNKPGTSLTRTQYHTPAQVDFPDVYEYITETGPKKYRPQDATRIYQTATPRQIIDQQHIDEIKMFEELMKEYGGKKEGGAITVKPKKDGQKFKPGKKPDQILKHGQAMPRGKDPEVDISQIVPQMSAGGKLSKVALEAIQRMKAMRPEIAAKSSLEQKALTENTAKYARDIQPFSMTDEEVAAEIKRLESKGMAGGGEVNADDLILEERPL